MTVVFLPHWPQTHWLAVQATVSSTRSRCRGSSLRPGCLRRGLPAACCRWFQRLALALGLNLFARYAWLQIEQFQLKIAQRLAVLAVSLDALLAKTLFEHPDL
jgi:hypothetical protein